MRAKQVIVSGGFDDIRSPHLRFLEEAAKFGELTVLLWPDEALRQHTGKAPKFPLAERLYFLNAVRYVARVIPLTAPIEVNSLPKIEGFKPQVWVHEEGLEHGVLPAAQRSGFPEPLPMPSAPGPPHPPRPAV